MKTFKQFLKEDVAPTDEAGNAKEAIMQLFKDNEIVDDGMVHALSDKLGIDTRVFEGIIYSILSSFFHAGKALNFNGSFDPKQLEMGIKVEMEHTTDPLIAERIAKDHLAEDLLYYTHLIEMEAEAGIKESNQINESGEFKIDAPQLNKKLDFKAKYGNDILVSIISKRYYNKKDANAALKEIEKKYNTTIFMVKEL